LQKKEIFYLVWLSKWQTREDLDVIKTVVDFIKKCTVKSMKKTL
jgi:hypothetical protein